MNENNVESERIAKCIDLIFEYLIKVRERVINEKPTADNANHYVYKHFSKMRTWDFEYAHNIMKDLGYIKYRKFEDGTINAFKIKPKGILVFLNGGHSKIIRRDKRQKQLITIVQFAATIGGIHYLIQILKEIISWVCSS